MSVRMVEVGTCPICPHVFEAPAPTIEQGPGLLNGIANAMGMPGGGAALASIHDGQNAHRLEGDIRRHLNGHTVEEWLTKVRDLQAQLDAALEALT